MNSPANQNKQPLSDSTQPITDKTSNDDAISVMSFPETYNSFDSTGPGDLSLATTSSWVEGLRSRAESTFSEGTLKLRELDVALEKELKDEPILAALDADAIPTVVVNPNPYQLWECGFGFSGKFDEPATIPDTKDFFIEAVKGEIATVSYIQNGLTSYNKAINSGEHHAFSAEFLKQQNNATNVTIGQLFQISRNLQDVVKEVEAIEGNTSEVKAEMKEAFAHAQPWIQRTRAILVSSHVFYKVNYVLGGDKKLAL